MFRVIKGELEIGARWRLRMASLENQNNAIFPFPRYYRTGVYHNNLPYLILSHAKMPHQILPYADLIIYPRKRKEFERNGRCSHIMKFKDMNAYKNSDLIKLYKSIC